MLAPFASRDALIGILAVEVVALVGLRVCFASKFDPSMKSIVPLGTPAPPGMAETETLRVVACLGSRM